MNYEFYLMAEFETADIPLELVAAKYLGYGRAGFTCYRSGLAWTYCAYLSFYFYSL